MSEGFVLGVDLGTSHTVAMLRHPDGRTRPLLFDGRPLLSSAAYLDTTGRLHVGHDALRLGLAEPGRVESHPKRHVDDGSVQLGTTDVAVSDLLAALLGAVAREAVATAGFLPPAVLTYPASWGAPRRRVLVEALAKAGWPRETRLLPEPVAAARYFADVLRRPVPVGGSLAVFDFGGGTLDIAVVRNDGAPEFSVTASGGDDDLGGLDLDAALVDHLGKTLAGAEPEAWQAITSPQTLAQWRARRQFWEDVRGAKEMLSRSSFAPIPVPGVEHAVHLTRDELEAAADTLIRRAVAEARAVIEASGVAPADLAGLFLVGGSSRVPMVARLLHAELGVAPTVLEQPELPVAEGALVAAWPHHATDSAASAQGTRPSDSAPTGQVAASQVAADGGNWPDYATGLAEAATPTPTPATVAENPPPITDTSVDPSPIAEAAAPASIPEQRGSLDDSRVLALPVEPWATGEARALDAGGHGFYQASPASGTYSGAFAGGGPGQNGGPTGHGGGFAGGVPGSSTLGDKSGTDGKKGLRRRAYVLIAGVSVVVLVVAGALVWRLLPADRTLTYHSLKVLSRVTAAVPISSSWTDVEVLGDRVYLATSADSGDDQEAVVTAVDSGETEATWTSKNAGVATGWDAMYALPGAVVLVSRPDSGTSTRELVALKATDGSHLWTQEIGYYDDFLFVGETVIWRDVAGKKVYGLSLRDGTVKWHLDDSASNGSSSTLVASTTPADLDGPATIAGRPLDPLGDDTRIVQIDYDRSVRVFDATTGKVLATKNGIADTSDSVVAHNGRFFVSESETAHRIVSYRLDTLDQPRILYQEQDEDGRIDDLSPCGDDRICFVESQRLDSKTDTVVAVDAVKGGKIWSHPLAGADSLVPVGDAVLAAGDSATALIDAKGHALYSGERYGARLNATNVLWFDKQPTLGTDSPSMQGQHLGDDPVELGPLDKIRTGTCSWNTALLACAAETDYALLTFAG